jgi:hypothetical protein
MNENPVWQRCSSPAIEHLDHFSPYPDDFMPLLKQIYFDLNIWGPQWRLRQIGLTTIWDRRFSGRPASLFSPGGRR